MLSECVATESLAPKVHSLALARLGQSISDWQSFHEACRKAFGFPDFYGMNMGAWVDCLFYLDEDAGMTRFNLAEGEMLHIEISATESFNRRLPEVLSVLFGNGRALFGRCHPDFPLSSGSALRLLLYRPAPKRTPDLRTYRRAAA